MQPCQLGAAAAHRAPAPKTAGEKGTSGFGGMAGSSCCGQKVRLQGSPDLQATKDCRLARRSSAQFQLAALAQISNSLTTGSLKSPNTKPGWPKPHQPETAQTRSCPDIFNPGYTHKPSIEQLLTCCGPLLPAIRSRETAWHPRLGTQAASREQLQSSRHLTSALGRAMEHEWWGWNKGIADLG